MRLTTAAACALILRCLGMLLGAILVVLSAVEPAAAQQMGDLQATFKRFEEFYNARNYPAALIEAQKVEAGVKARFGVNHPNYAVALHNLANAYNAQRKYAEAEGLYKRALAIREKALGEDHPNVARTLNDLGFVYTEQGKYGEAEELHKRALAISEKALGRDHPDVAGALNNLAVLYLNQGRYIDAEPLYQRSLAILEKALGRDHPDVAGSLNNFATLYENQSRYADAEPLYQRSLAIREKTLGRDHPDFAQSLNDLARLYQEQGRFADALPLVQGAIANGRASPEVALPVLIGAQRNKLISAETALDDGLNVAQRANQTAAASAISKLAVRLAAGSDRLAQLVRKDQDLAAEAAALDKAILAALSKEPAKRDAATEHRIRDRLAAIAAERNDLQQTFAKEFPDYTALSNPLPLTAKEVQAAPQMRRWCCFPLPPRKATSLH